MKSHIIISLFFCILSSSEINCNTCGKRVGVRGRLHGGKAAGRNSWPWLVAFQKIGDNSFLGAGNLISEKFIMTSASAFAYKGTEPISHDGAIAKLGAYDLEVPDEFGTLRSNLSKVIIHQDWSKVKNTSYDADIAIAVLVQAVTFTHYIQPICLPIATSSEPKIPGTVAAWGYTQTSDKASNVPFELNFPVYNGTYCLNTYNGIGILGSQRMFCAGYSNSEKGICYDDHGSGFYHLNNQTDAYELAGIASHFLEDDSSCDVNKFGLFTNVNWFIGWTNDVTENLSLVV